MYVQINCNNSTEIRNAEKVISAYGMHKKRTEDIIKDIPELINKFNVDKKHVSYVQFGTQALILRSHNKYFNSEIKGISETLKYTDLYTVELIKKVVKSIEPFLPNALNICGSWYDKKVYKLLNKSINHNTFKSFFFNCSGNKTDISEGLTKILALNFNVGVFLVCPSGYGVRVKKGINKKKRILAQLKRLLKKFGYKIIEYKTYGYVHKDNYFKKGSTSIWSIYIKKIGVN
jgi:hypothetical protein